MAVSIVELKTVCERIVQHNLKDNVLLAAAQENYIAVIDTGKLIIEEAEHITDDIQGFKNQCIQYAWAEEFKQYVILLRDIHQQRFASKYDGGNISKDTTQHLLERATNSMLDELDRIYAIQSIDEKVAKTWKHQLSPASTVINQLDNIKSHLTLISGSEDAMADIERDILFFNSEIRNHIDLYGHNVEKIDQAVSNVKTALMELPDEMSMSDITAMSKIVESTYQSIDSLRRVSNTEEWHFECGHKVNIPVGLNEGNLVTKTIDFDNQVNNWVEKSLVPTLINMDAQMEKMGHSVMTKMVNMKNQIAHISANPELVNSVGELGFLNTIDGCLKSVSETKEGIILNQSKLQSKLEEDLHISNVFRQDHYFLTKAPKTRITEYTESGSSALISKLPLQKLKEWYSRFFDRYISGGNEDEFHDKDQIELVNFIRSRSIGNVDKYYHSLFYSKGFLGQTFFYNRVGFMSKFDNVFENWQDGFPGSMLVYGSCLSGKSTLLEAVAYQSYKYNVINLKPNEQVVFKGQKIEIGNSISDTFKVLEKHTTGKKVLLIIDNLEAWGSSKAEYLSEVADLLQIMRRNSKRYFFLVATNSVMKSELEKYLEFSSSFISLYDTTAMQTNSIADIILVRERASQKSDKIIYDEEKLAHLKAGAVKIAKKCNNNIGVSLIEWTRYQSPNQIVKHTPKIFKTVVSNHSALLRYIVKWGSLKENEIAKLNNPNLASEMSRSIRELISLKILIMGIDGKLTIPDSLIDEVEESLDLHSILTEV
jgi:hypothetical protein